jgi:hypothetical protein
MIQDILSKNADLIDKRKNTFSFDKDFEGKGLLNKEISKLYDKSTTITEPQLVDIIINSNIIIEKMAKIKNCGWNISELKEQLETGVLNYKRRTDSGNKYGSHSEKIKLINSTAIGNHFNVSGQRMNLIFSELGWISKAISGWAITKLGTTIGGRQYEEETRGDTYVKWPETILQNKSLQEIFHPTPVEKEIRTPITVISQPTTKPEPTQDYREKWEAKHRTLDGHYVRSISEMTIDNLLYQYGLVHAYERKIFVGDEEVLSDFYLPAGKVYIEFWGMEGDEKYNERKRKKIEFYKKNEIPLIQLHSKDILNLDDVLQKELKNYGIKVY